MGTAMTTGQLIEVFGDFKPFLNEEGKPSIFWEEEILTKIELPEPLPLAWNKKLYVSAIRCHKKIAPFLLNAFLDAYTLGEVWATINDYGGCYEFRRQRNSASRLSTHCFATSVDLDVGDNPFGANPKVHPKLVEIFAAQGFSWGGNFAGKRKDGMHFEFTDLSRLS